jgi:hypothetical protein
MLSSLDLPWVLLINVIHEMGECMFTTDIVCHTALASLLLSAAICIGLYVLGVFKHVSASCTVWHAQQYGISMVPAALLACLTFLCYMHQGVTAEKRHVVSLAGRCMGVRAVSK